MRVNKASNSAIESIFQEVVRSAAQLGAVTDEWDLVQGISNGRSSPWAISDRGARPVVVLGYSRREALTALISMNAILAAVLEHSL